MDDGKALALTLREFLGLFNYDELSAVSWISVVQRVDKTLWRDCLNQPGNLIIAPKYVIIYCLGPTHLELYVNDKYFGSIRMQRIDGQEIYETVACTAFETYDVRTKSQMVRIPSAKINRFGGEKHDIYRRWWDSLRQWGKFTLNGEVFNGKP